jgi:hypothetical protein
MTIMRYLIEGLLHNVQLRPPEPGRVAPFLNVCGKGGCATDPFNTAP